MESYKCCVRDEKVFRDLVIASRECEKVALELKESLKNEKKKLSEYRDFNSKLYDDIGMLEEDVKDKDSFITKLTRERNKLQNDVKFATEKFDLKNIDISKLEENQKKQKETSQQFLRQIMDENAKLKQQLEAMKNKEAAEEVNKLNIVKLQYKENDLKAEISKLEQEIEKLCVVHAEKEFLIEEIGFENKVLTERVLILEEEKRNIERENGENADEGFTAKSLEEEIASFGFRSQTLFECTYCSSKTPSKADLKKHVEETHLNQARIELAKVEKKVLEQLDTFYPERSQDGEV